MPNLPIRSRRRTLGLLAAALPLSWLGACSPAGGPDAPVSLETARAELEAGRALVFDIREPHEHATGVAAGMRLLPMSQLPLLLTNDIQLQTAQNSREIVLSDGTRVHVNRHSQICFRE